MRRSAIGLMLTLALGLLLAPFAAEAQQPTQVHRIGVLTDSYSSRPPPDLKAAQEELLPLGYAELEAFRHGLRDLGYVEGQSIALEYRFIGPKPTPTLLANSKSFCFSRLMCGQA